MSIQADCGPHCGISTSGHVTREGHCDCVTCHDGSAPVVITREDLTRPAGSGVAMCARWYERAGDFRPWHRHAA